MIKQFFNYVLVALLITTVLLVVPFSDSFIFDTKKLVLFAAGFTILGATTFQLWKSKSLMLTFSPFCAALTALATSVLVSSFLTTSYPYENLFGWGGVLLMVTIVAGLGHELVSKKDAQQVPLVFAGAGAGLALLSALQAFGYGPSRLYNMVFGTAFPHNALFNLTESPIVALQVLLVAVVGLASYVLQKKDHADDALPIGLGATLLVGIGVMGWAAFINPETKAINMLSLQTNSAVARGVLSSPKSALIGMGPNSFAHAYNLHKPASTNATKTWDIEFANGINFPLTIVATLGLFGLLSWAALVFFIVKHVVKDRALHTEPLTLMVVALIALQLLFPPTIVMMVLFGVMLAYWLATQAHSFEKVKMHTLITRLSPDNTKAASVSITHFVSIGVSVLMALFVVASLYGSVRAFGSSYLFFKSSQALAANKPASEIYELQRSAVGMNPFIDINRRRYALTNLAVAQALAAKPDINDAEREQVLQLIQQSIREGRAATMLQPEDARNWEALATIYQNLMGVATGADQWAVNSLSRAIETDPTNPVLWFQLGSTFYQNQQYAEASRIFAQAVQLKSDYLNAYYNLANALRMNNQLTEAKQVYQELMIQVPTESAEYSIIKSEAAVVDGLINSKNSSSSAQPETSVIEEGLSTPDNTVPAQTDGLSNEAKQFLEATPTN